MKKKNVLAINGSASRDSSNLALLKYITQTTTLNFEFQIIESLSYLPHFQTELSCENTPLEIIEFRNLIGSADAVLFCTPEYIFSIPSGLKNALEWCVSTTIFTKKPIGIITASANGEKGHEELQLILKTLDAKFNNNTTLLISGLKGKINSKDGITHQKTIKEIESFLVNFKSNID